MTLRGLINNFFTERGCSPRVGFIGLGISNLALARELTGVDITVRDRGVLDCSHLSMFESPRVFKGKDYLSDIDEDILVLSPSVRRDAPEIIGAVKGGAILTSDAELYFSDSDGQNYLVTGSDGKSTTATIAALLLEERYPEIEAIGNIGKPFSDYSGHRAVAELSSFQLSYLTPRSRAAIITTVTPNHLNWHKSIEEYIEAKLNIARETERLILSPDTPLEEELLHATRPSGIYSMKHSLSELKRKYPFAEDFITFEKCAIQHNGAPIIEANEIKRAEGHNIHNLMGAIALTLGEFSTEHLRRVAREFAGLEHRMEKFLKAGGVDFINSSIDTTPARTRATLEALKRPVKIILGGGAKGLSILPLIPALTKYATKIALYGDAGGMYFAEILDRGIDSGERTRLFDKFDGALGYILDGLTDGDTVLLSPAATGYGEFRDFTERGRYFKDYIKKLYT